MGCGESKLGEEAAVAHCRERSLLLADAIRHRYALADAHAAYARSLRAVGDALAAFLAGDGAPLPASPVLHLPNQRKGDGLPGVTPSPPPTGAFLARSGSHIDFRPSDSESDEEDSDSTLHSDGTSPVHHLHVDGDPMGPTYVNVNHSRSRPAEASVVYEQQQPSTEPVCFSSIDEPPPTAYLYYSQPYPSQNSNFYPYPAHTCTSYGDGADVGFFGSSFPPPCIPPAAVAVVGGSPASPWLPSPPRTSTWDFLNPFDSYDNCFSEYASKRRSDELRADKVIPAMEDEQQEVKALYSDLKFAASPSAATNGEFSAEVDSLKEAEEDDNQKSRSLEVTTSSEPEVKVVENTLLTEPVDKSKTAAFTVPRSYQDISDVIKEIKTQFYRASEPADQLAKMLEVGKFLYNQKNSVYKAVSARMISSLPPLFTFKNEDLLLFEEDKAMECGNLSSTLQKLYNWEKKLLEEVMAEEKMRVVFDGKCEQLKRLSERGAEAEKLEAVEASIRKLTTKIRIAIQVVDTIASKINQLRDEELLPQIVELIGGLRKMWALMFECHHIQFQAFSAAKDADSTMNEVKLNDVHMDVIKQLELGIVDWIEHFSAWVNAQRSFVKSLNSWLVKGIHYVPQVTEDGCPPLSPRKLGAPPVFVICNYWSESMDMISERNVVNAMRSFAHNVFLIWQQHNLEQRQRWMANRDMGVNLRLIEKDEQLMLKHKNKLKLISVESGMPIPEHVAHHDSTLNKLSISLRQIFEAMEDFAASSVKAYEVPLMNQEDKG